MPAGKAITVLNFFHDNPRLPLRLFVRIGSSPAVLARVANHPDTPVDNKDITIDGPAQVFFLMQSDDSCILSYKLFNN